MAEKTKVLKVNMLGGFTMTYGDEEVVLGRNTTAKFVQLLQLIWLRGEKGISKAHIVRALYDTEDLSNPNNSFNNLIFQMRKQTVAAGLPKKDYVVKEGKVFVPDPDVPVFVDALEFYKFCEKAEAEKDPAKKYELYGHAFDLYRGELLPESQTKPWVITESVKLHQLFDEATDYMGRFAKEQKDYDTMYAIYEKAAKIYPDNDWQAYQIDALICKEEYKEAYQLYDKTVHQYSDEMGLPPSEKMLENYSKMSSKITSPTSRLDEIQSSLQEDPVSGAYYCAYPSFIDCYHVLDRNMERTGYSVFLLLCTLVDYEGKPISNKNKLELRSDALRGCISASLRRGDIFTKYSSSQYLVLLVGSSREGCDVVSRRISKRLKAAEGTRAEVKYNTVSLADLSLTPRDI